METTPSRRLAWVGLGVVLLLITGCGPVVDPLTPSSSAGSGPGGQALVVGAAATTESNVVAELYAQALTAKGVPATTRANVGTRADYLAALGDGSISLVPEYAGALLLHYDEDATATTAAEVDEALPGALPSDLTLGTPSTAVDQDSYVVTRRFSEQHGVRSLADLEKVPGGLVLGGPSALPSRAYGPVGLEKIYGARLKAFKPSGSSAVRSRDLNAGRIQLGEFASTEPAIADNSYVVLADPQAMILPQHLVPLMRTQVADDPTATSTLDAVQQALTTRELAALDRAVDVDHDAARQVAADWLRRRGLG